EHFGLVGLADFLEHPAGDPPARHRIGIENEFVGHVRYPLPLDNERPIWGVQKLTAMCRMSRRCACRSVRCQYAIHVHTVARATERGRDRRSPQLACDTRQRAELLLAD